ncbi:MAG: hypothetical protein V3V75_06435 [Thermoguttaceae bacterium]
MSVCFATVPTLAQQVTLPDIDTSGSPNGIVPFPPDTPAVFTDVFSKYTKLIAPGGKPIHFLIQDAWSDDKIIKTRNIMQHILTDFPGSEYGDDKSAVANAMADRKATMTMFNTSVAANEARQGSFGRGATDLFRQSLWENETTAEGSEDYMNHITRDAAYEEVLHLVQGSGIMPALPEFQAKILAATEAATDRGWGPPNDNPPGWHFEYFAQQFDNYLDLWAVKPKKYEGRDLQPGRIPDGTSHFGQNEANSRATLLKTDPVGYEIETSFFHPYLTYTPLLPPEFQGTFSLEFDESTPYTYKSQHLRSVTLRGDNDARLRGNRHENVLRGNAGDNVLRGGGADDQLHGGGGRDTAIFSGVQADYVITEHDGHLTVADRRLGRDGTDLHTSIEILQFRDQQIER